MAFVTTTSPDLYATTSNLEEIPAGADPLEYADDEKMNQILVGLTALHGWASGVPVSETASGHFLALAAGSSAAVSVAGGVRIRSSSGALDYSYNTGAYVRLLSKLTLASQATGDIMYASAADTWTRLAAGTDGHVLTLSGGVPVWAAGGGGGGLSSPVGAADGGTGITSYAIGDLIYASGATTLSKLADVATGNALISGGVTTAPAWGKIGLTTHVDGTLPAANGGTGQGGGYAVGDLLYASGASALSKLAAVAVGQMLISTGVTTAPAWSAAGVLTSLTLTSGSSMKLLSWTSDTKMLCFAEVAASPSYRGIMGQSGSGTDVTGGPLRLQAGYGTGTGTAGTVEVWHSGIGLTGTAANAVVKSWTFTAPTQSGDATEDSHLLPSTTGYQDLGSTTYRLNDGWFNNNVYGNRFGHADDTDTYLSRSAADEMTFTFGGTARIRSDGSRTVWSYGGATPEAAAHIGEWYTDAAEGRIKVKSSNSSGYGGFIAKGSDANKILSMAVYGASTAGTTLGVTNASIAEVVAVAANMVIYTTGAQSLSLGTNSSASPVIQLGSTANTLGFYGVTPTARAAAYTQTYSTAARTVTSGMSVDQLAQIVNSLIDDLQAYGLAQ